MKAIHYTAGDGGPRIGVLDGETIRDAQAGVVDPAHHLGYVIHEQGLGQGDWHGG